MCLMRFVGLLTGKLLHLAQVIENRYLRLTAFLLFLLNWLHHHIVQRSLLGPQISDIIPEFRRLYLLRLQRGVFLLRRPASRLLLLMYTPGKFLNLLN